MPGVAGIGGPGQVGKKPGPGDDLMQLSGAQQAATSAPCVVMQVARQRRATTAARGAVDALADGVESAMQSLEQPKNKIGGLRALSKRAAGHLYLRV